MPYLSVIPIMARKKILLFAIRIAYGYSSTNAKMVAKDMLQYYYNLEDETEF